MHLSTSIKRVLVSGVVALGLLPFNAYAAQCYMGGNGFGIILPGLAERGCFLYFHEVREFRLGVGVPGAITLPSVELHPDQLHAEFVQMQLEGKIISVRKGTPLFDCQYDLTTLKRDASLASLVGNPLPEFNCRGLVSRWVPVRPLNMNKCYWVALEDVQCEDAMPGSMTFQFRDKPEERQ